VRSTPLTVSHIAQRFGALGPQTAADIEHTIREGELPRHVSGRGPPADEIHLT
jgi:hypothetical protein